MKPASKIWFVLLFFISTQALGATGIWKKDLETMLDQNGVKRDHYGIEIRSVDGQKIYFSANADSGFNPASTLKLAISIAALEKMGVQQTIPTYVKKQGRDLCLIGRGDPSLVYENMFLMVESLLRSPQFDHTVKNIIADDSYFPTIRQYGEEFDDDSQRSFTAPLSALSLNYNSVTIFVKPGQVGGKANAYTEPNVPYFVIHNESKTVSKGSKTVSARTEEKDHHLHIYVSGQIAFNEKEAVIYRGVPDPAFYAASVFKDLLQRAGVTISGEIENKPCDSNASDLIEFPSKPLSQIILGMNKFSNNFIAETLLLHLGNQPSSESGMENMLAWLKSKKFPMTNVVVQNASGLSRDNSVTPHFLWELFAYGRNTFSIFPELMSSLPIAATDGTLRRRFHTSLLEGLVRAKSGSLKGSVSLVGSIQTQSQGELLFVFLFDTAGKNPYDIQMLEEKLLSKVAELGKNGS